MHCLAQVEILSSSQWVCGNDDRNNTPSNALSCRNGMILLSGECVCIVVVGLPDPLVLNWSLVSPLVLVDTSPFPVCNPSSHLFSFFMNHEGIWVKNCCLLSWQLWLKYHDFVDVFSRHMPIPIICLLDNNAINDFEGVFWYNGFPITCCPQFLSLADVFAGIFFKRRQADTIFSGDLFLIQRFTIRPWLVLLTKPFLLVGNAPDLLPATTTVCFVHCSQSKNNCDKLVLWICFFRPHAWLI